MPQCGRSLERKKDSRRPQAAAKKEFKEDWAEEAKAKASKNNKEARGGKEAREKADGKVEAGTRAEEDMGRAKARAKARQVARGKARANGREEARARESNRSEGAALTTGPVAGRGRQGPGTEGSRGKARVDTWRPMGRRSPRGIG